MVLSQQDLLRLLESLRSADGLELVRRVAERMPQELIEAEATARIGAEWNGHTDTRTALRNGQRDKTLTIQAGDLDLAILKLRSGSFFPALLQRRRRIDQALHAVIMEAYVHGVSTRSVGDLAKALGADTRVSKSEISRICQDLDGQLTVFRSRRLDHIRLPCMYLGATYCKARIEHRIVSRAVVIATGITEDGGREVLGVMVGDSETEVFWPWGPSEDGAHLDDLVRGVPLQRYASLAEVVHAVAMLATPVFDFANGATYLFDGCLAQQLRSQAFERPPEDVGGR